MEAHGRFALFVWICTGLYFYLTRDDFSGPVSLSGLTIFLIGSFAAALFFGAAGYLAQRGIARLMVNDLVDPLKNAAVIRVVGYGLYLVELVAIIAAAAWVVGMI